VYFHAKKNIFGRSGNEKIWFILWPIGIFYGYFVTLWLFGMYQEKSGIRVKVKTHLV
jgi:hypothetical protein